MNKVEEIEQNLSKIKALIDKEEQVYESSEIFYGAMGARLGFRKKIEVFRENFSIFCLLKNFFSSNTLNNIEERLRPLLKLYEEFSSSNQNITNRQSTLDEFYKAIDNLPDLREVSLDLPENINKDDFENLLNLLRNQYGIFLDDENEEFFNKTSLLDFREHQENLIKLYNNVISKNGKRIPEIMYFIEYFNVLMQKSKLYDVKKQLDNARDQLGQVNSSISSNSNTKLKQVFDTEAKSLKCSIRILHCTIFLLFLFLLGIIFLAAYMIFYKQIQNVSDYYVLYLSTFLTVTALLSYLIRERNRIVKYQHYCKISYLEISALSDYTAQLNDKGKSEELKIQLAHRYFQGPNGHANQTADEKDLSYFSSKINELTNMVKDIKSLVDK